jgi:hypothetical protein
MLYINVCQIIRFCKLSLFFFYRSSAIHLEKIICQMIATMTVSLHFPLTSALNDFVHICEGRSSTVGSTWFHYIFLWHRHSTILSIYVKEEAVGSTWFHYIFFYENSHCLRFYYSFLFVWSDRPFPRQSHWTVIIDVWPRK